MAAMVAPAQPVAGLCESTRCREVPTRPSLVGECRHVPGISAPGDLTLTSEAFWPTAADHDAVIQPGISFAAIFGGRRAMSAIETGAMSHVVSLVAISGDSHPIREAAPSGHRKARSSDRAFERTIRR